MYMAYKLGSLFDGSGGFPLAGSLCGIEPVWASEVEPYPIAVTRSRFPNMRHLGDISKVNGGKIEPVDIITFGSPCQDLSVAGKRTGLKHEANGDEETTRSGLFMEAVRIIKEMREATNGEYPTFALWENVPGAFSSNRGEDFRTVLEELIKIVEPTAVMPPVPKAGWAYADSYCGDGWSLAYRVFDAQYWGVPQRRRRIHLVLDLRGERAREVLFEREGLQGYFADGRTPWKAVAGDAESGVGATDCTGECVTHTFQNTGQGWWNEYGVGATLRTPCGGYSTLANVVVKTVDCNILDDQGGQQITVRTDGKAPTLRAETHGNLPCVMEEAGFKAGQSMDGGIGWQKECAATLAAQCSGTEPTVCVKCYDARGNGDGQTVSTITGDHENCITDYTSVVCEPIPIHDKETRYKGGGPTRNGDGAGNGLGVGKSGDPCPTLSTCDNHMVCYIASGKGTTGTLMASMAEKQCLGDQEAFSCDYHVIEEREAKVFRQGAFSDYVEGEIGTLRASGVDYGGGTENLLVERPTIHYIVRRLTPTECARLQGFPDAWGHPDHKDDFTDEEYRFWCDVVLTKSLVDGTVAYNEDGELYFVKRLKPYKPKNKAQMLTWYNKLHTDSAEYKMWGNGIALPPALYCMQGIVDAMGREEIMNIEEIVARVH